MYREIFLLTVLLAIAYSKPNRVRIVGGRQSVLGEYPSLVAIFKKGWDDDFFCGGDLITYQHVASAAHCFRDDKKPNDIYIIAGEKNIFRRPAKTRRKLFVKEIISHPEFRETDATNDFAILVLTKPVERNKSIKTVKLSKQRPAPGTKCTVTGWGHVEEEGSPSEQAMKADVYVWTRQQCHNIPGTVDSSMFCAGVQRGGAAICYGDSGGPLFCNDKLAGIVSWGVNCTSPDYPGVYADVSTQRDWFTQQIAKTSFFRRKGKNQSSEIISARVEMYFMLVLLTLSYSNSLNMPFIYSNVNS